MIIKEIPKFYDGNVWGPARGILINKYETGVYGSNMMIFTLILIYNIIGIIYRY
jgi:hypothetical protein